MALRGLAGKVALVSGAAQGIGAATVARLLEEGCKVVAMDLKADGLAQYAGNAAVATITGNITKAADCDAAVALAVARFGALNLLAHCAGILHAVAPMAEMDEEAFDHIMAVNVKGTMLMMRASLRQMVAQKQGGAIACISSMAALRAGPTRSAYCASKRAVIGLTSTAAAEYGPHGIRVNALAPGMIDTPIIQGVGPAQMEVLMNQVRTRPIARLGLPEEMAAVMAWLLSDESSYVTGSLQLADGGTLA
jgi:NAD(P)-dependent dehydrogenase (short-subunit alcohol dehydrogenase family)